MQRLFAQVRPSFAGTALLLSLTSFALAAPADWPQFLGPNRDGASAETGLLQELPPGGPPLVWKANGIGVGYSTVSVVGDRIYTIGEDSEASSVVALNATDGKKVWASKLGKAGAPGQPAFEGPRATPTVEGDLLLAVSQWGELACYDADQGKELWRKDYTKDFGGKRPNWGYAESPLIDGDKVVITPGGMEGSIVALIEASPDGYKEHGRFEQPDRSSKTAWPYPVISHGKPYLRDWDTLLYYDVKGK